MLSYDNFKKEVLQQVNDRLEGSTNAVLSPIRKNNDTLWDGLIIYTDGSDIAPTIYLNSYYDRAYMEGESISSIADDLVRQYRNSLPEKPLDVSFFSDFDKVKDMIIFRVINNKRNSSLLEDVPHIDYLDLSITFSCLISLQSSHDATILIHNNHMDSWQTTPAKLYELALNNTPRLLGWKLTDMKDIIKGLAVPSDDIIPDSEDLAFPIHVLSNRANINGASCILYSGLLKKISEDLDSDCLYIIPSSVHEVLILQGASDVNSCDLDNIICQVNSTTLSEEEILSDHVYYYVRDTDELSCTPPIMQA